MSASHAMLRRGLHVSAVRREVAELGFRLIHTDGNDELGNWKVAGHGQAWCGLTLEDVVFAARFAHAELSRKDAAPRRFSRDELEQRELLIESSS